VGYPPPPGKIQKILGISRATYYRRKRFLMDGVIKSKFKICILLRRDYDIQISESSVGRILEPYEQGEREDSLDMQSPGNSRSIKIWRWERTYR
jgi:hypothetical protein